MRSALTRSNAMMSSREALETVPITDAAATDGPSMARTNSRLRAVNRSGIRKTDRS
jgi:hypothetical protein